MELRKIPKHSDKMLARFELPSERRVVELCGGPLFPQPDHRYANLARVGLPICLYRDQEPFAAAKHLLIDHSPDSAVPVAYDGFSVDAHAARKMDGLSGCLCLVSIGLLG